MKFILKTNIQINYKVIHTKYGRPLKGVTDVLKGCRQLHKEVDIFPTS